MSFFDELKRRNVFRVSAAYLALGWVTTQVTGAVVPALHLPDSIPSIVVWIGVIAFPFVVVFSWVFELTPEGLKLEHEVEHTASITQLTARRLDHITIGIIALGVLLFAFEQFGPRRGGSQPVVEASPAALPSAQTTALAPAATAPVLPLIKVSDKSIAVLPFINMSEDAKNEYFSDGISEELLNLLTKIPELQVTSRSSAFAFKGEKIDITDVGAKLHVAHVLEGSVRKSGNKVRITAQLIDARTDTHLWSETYDRTLDDIFAVQDEIAGAVVAQLKIKLLGTAPKVKVVNPEAYALFLQARQLYRQFTPTGFEQAIALYQQALVLDPGYAAAWDELARVYINQGGNGLRPIDEAYRMAREAVNKALALDPGYARAYDNLGWIAASYDGDLAAAARHYEHALALDPANTNIIANAATIAGSLGRLDTAFTLQQYANARDPVNPIGQVNMGGGYIIIGRLDDAIASLRTALRLSPGFLSAESAIGEALLLKGEPEAALVEVQKEASEVSRLIGLALVYHALGRNAESDTALADLIRKYEKEAAYYIASVLAFRGETDGAFEWLDQAVVYHDGGLTGVASDPLLFNIRKDPRWLPFLRKIGKAPEQLAAIKFEVTLPK